jgi:hypothetical protein
MAAQRIVRLLEDVTVDGATVRLSDLLPPATPAALTTGTENIVVGRAPEPGTVRVISGMTIRASLPEKVSVEIPVLVVVHRQQFPIEPEAVKEALKESSAGKQIDFSQAQIRIPAGFASRIPKPQLELLDLAHGFDRVTLIASLRCRERTACGRFVAEIILPNPLMNDDSLVGTHSFTAVRSPGFPSHSDSTPFLVQPGAPAWLVVENSGMKITQRVMPLKKARAGELVRVTDPITHRVFVAQVVGEKLLRPASPGAEIAPERTR